MNVNQTITHAAASLLRIVCFIALSLAWIELVDASIGKVGFWLVIQLSSLSDSIQMPHHAPLFTIILYFGLWCVSVTVLQILMILIALLVIGIAFGAPGAAYLILFQKTRLLQLHRFNCVHCRSQKENQ